MQVAWILWYRPFTIEWTISMTMNGLPEVNIQGVPQYWIHLFLAFLSVYIHPKCSSWGSFEKLLQFRLVYKVGLLLWNIQFVYFRPFLVIVFNHSIKKGCAVLWQSRHLYGPEVNKSTNPSRGPRWWFYNFFNGNHLITLQLCRFACFHRLKSPQ